MKNILLLLLLLLSFSVEAQVSLMFNTNPTSNLTLSGTLTAAHISCPDLNTNNGTNIYYSTTNTFPFTPASNVFILDGQSLMTGMAPIFTNQSWFKGQVAGVYVVAVGATGLRDATNRWATNKANLCKVIGNGTNGIYMFWGMQGDVNGDPMDYWPILTNWVNEIVSSNFNFVMFTDEPIGIDIWRQINFLPVMNNLIRTWDKFWRVVETDQLVPNLFDWRLYKSNSFDHMYDTGYTNIAQETTRILATPYRKFSPQSCVNIVNTNIVITHPGYRGYLQQFIASFGVQGFELGTNGYPPGPLSPGGATHWNSNGTMFLLTSGPGGTSWTGTNKLGP